ncbi:MAG: site-specific DNA-methyltransferase [Candidatus Bathyarchaeota archaeon]|nr:site-specific DNA-methyltransferase [Candidatus Bathyarchaeota archaeon]MDH5745430.1 site-specific DNA-methyltransferase [Candidatus Bathyarchaeota archaeon]
MKHILKYFASLKTDESWTYRDLTPKDTAYLTHSYHRYPAKFIPQLVRRIIKEYSNEEELICDPFVGCGTTLLEALLIQRRALGVDINPVAYLITKAKTTYIKPQLLEMHVSKLFAKLNPQKNKTDNKVMERIRESPNYDRVRFWFGDDTIRNLSLILSLIEDMQEKAVQDFLKCGFSHILKNCSCWNMDSIKPARDKDKNIPRAIPTFKRRIIHMTRKNKEYYEILPKKVKARLSDYLDVFCEDCRHIPCEDEYVSIIATSPPYVTSYEYADLHQLTLLWINPETDMTENRKDHIGTTQPKDVSVKEIHSEIGNEIVRRLKNEGSKVNGNKNHYLNGCADAVFTYFAEMQQAFEQFTRVLKPGGIASIVIGNTTLGDVNILNAEVLSEISINVGFKLLKVIKRQIPSNKKWLPSIRNQETGQFASTNCASNKLVYPHEYIIILEKP